MTQRKPPGTSFESFADAQIRRAREEGLFDDLPGKGKPLDTRDAYDPLWWAKKLVAREGVSVLPPSLAIRRQVEDDMKRILALPSEGKVREAVAALNEQIRAANRARTDGPPSSQPVLDADAIVTKWRAVQEP
jgi:hypothetical protein